MCLRLVCIFILNIDKIYFMDKYFWFKIHLKSLFYATIITDVLYAACELFTRYITNT